MNLQMLFVFSVSVSSSLASLPSEVGSDLAPTNNPLPKFPRVRNPRRKAWTRALSLSQNKKSKSKIKLMKAKTKNKATTEDKSTKNSTKVEKMVDKDKD